MERGWIIEANTVENCRDYHILNDDEGCQKYCSNYQLSWKFPGSIWIRQEYACYIHNWHSFDNALLPSIIICILYIIIYYILIIWYNDVIKWWLRCIISYYWRLGETRRQSKTCPTTTTINRLSCLGNHIVVISKRSTREIVFFLSDSIITLPCQSVSPRFEFCSKFWSHATSPGVIHHPPRTRVISFR